MVKWIEVQDKWGNEVILNVANIQSYRSVYNDNRREYEYNFNGYTCLVDQDMHDKIMDAVDEYCDEFEKLVGANEGSNEGSKEVVIQNTNGLDSRDIRYKILNADFMSAEQKLKLIVSLNV